MSDFDENEETIKYCTPQSPTHSLHLFDQTFQASHGVIELPVKYANELERLIKTGKRPDLSQGFVKIDEEASKILVENWKAKNLPAARSGMFTHDMSPEKQAAMNAERVSTMPGSMPDVSMKDTIVPNDGKTENIHQAPPQEKTISDLLGHKQPNPIKTS